MKSLLFVAAMLLLPLSLALADEKPADPVENCKAKAAFKYHFDMMKIEGSEIRNEISHDAAGLQKRSRHLEHLGELAECDELKKD